MFQVMHWSLPIGEINHVILYALLCRYDFPWNPTKYIPFYGGADYHDYHHYVGEQSQSNFASVFTYCDFIYGTDKVIIKKILQPNYVLSWDNFNWLLIMCYLLLLGLSVSKEATLEGKLAVRLFSNKQKLSIN